MKKRRLSIRQLKRLPKDGASRHENLSSQPHVPQPVFNNPEVLTQGWYPVCAARELRTAEARSFKILHQRLVVFRTATGQLCAMDAFCPHLGADLGNGRVVGERIQCYFHQWELSTQGQLARIPCREHLEPGFQKVKNRTYPVVERYGHIWVFSAEEALHDLPQPSHLKGVPLTARWVQEIRLFAHHHVMMCNGIDLQHFASVHNLDIAFDYEVKASESGVFEWTLKGEIPTNTFKARLARALLGDTYEYHVKFAGGSVVTISYGVDQYLGRFKLPSLQILWGCLPQPSGVSRARIFFLSPAYKGLLGPLRVWGVYCLTLLMLLMLRDEDLFAFPNMRFNAHQLIKEDRSLGRFIQLTNQLPLSDWGKLPTSEESS